MATCAEPLHYVHMVIACSTFTLSTIRYCALLNDIVISIIVIWSHAVVLNIKALLKTRPYLQSWISLDLTTQLQAIAIMQQKIALMLLSLVALSGYVNSQRSRCPNPVECTDDPCADARCPTFINVECRTESCFGECRARFYEGRVDITRHCFRGFETCRQRERDSPCAGNRMCVEEDVEGCRQNRRCQRTRCVRPTVRQPLTCDDLDCTDIKKKKRCEVFETVRGSVPRCVVYIPQNCEEIECEEGMVCEVRERSKDKKPVARCVAGQANPENPRRGDDCSEVKCDDDEVCIQLEDDKGARCTKPPPPTDCSQLRCPINMECLPIANGRRVRCVPRKGKN